MAHDAVDYGHIKILYKVNLRRTVTLSEFSLQNNTDYKSLNVSPRFCNASSRNSKVT